MPHVAAEAVVQLLLVELVVALLDLAGLQQRISTLGAKAQTAPSLVQIEQLHFSACRRVDLDGEGDGAAMAASGIGLALAMMSSWTGYRMVTRAIRAIA